MNGNYVTYRKDFLELQKFEPVLQDGGGSVWQLQQSERLIFENSIWSITHFLKSLLSQTDRQDTHAV